MAIGSVSSALLIGALALSAFGCAPEEREIAVRGVLIWTDEKQTLVPCGSDEIIWVRVLASNPHFRLYQRVKELSQSDAAVDLIASFKGNLSREPADPTLDYHIDGVLYVHEIISVERGHC